MLSLYCEGIEETYTVSVCWLSARFTNDSAFVWVCCLLQLVDQVVQRLREQELGHVADAVKRELTKDEQLDW